MCVMSQMHLHVPVYIRLIFPLLTGEKLNFIEETLYTIDQVTEQPLGKRSQFHGITQDI